MSALRDWAKLDAQWYRDPVLRAAAKRAPAVMVVWPVMVAMAKAESHAEHNPNGLILQSLSDIAHACCVTTKRAEAALAALVEGEFLTTVALQSNVVEIRLKTFSKWQTPRKSNAERLANLKWKTSREKASHGNGGDAVGKRSGHAKETVETCQTETLTETLTETVNPPVVTPQRKRRKPPTPTEQARSVFDHWVKVWEKGAATVFSAERVTAVQARLDEGYTVEQLTAAVSGYRNSDHHMGRNDKSRVWDELELFMRNASKVDAGIGHATAARNHAQRPLTPLTGSKPRHQITENYDEGIEWHDNTPAA